MPEKWRNRSRCDQQLSGAYMSLKLKLETLDGLDESLQGFYKESDDGFVLDVDGLEDTGALKRAKDHEKEARKAAETKLSELQAKLDEIEEGKARKSGDIEALENSYKEKLSKRESELSGKIEELTAKINNGLINQTAGELGSMALKGSESALAKLVKDRLSVDASSGEAKLVILDEQGKPSAMTVDEYKEEIRNNPAYAPLLSGSGASGSGATGSKGGGSASIDWNKATPQEKVAYLKSKRGN